MQYTDFLRNFSIVLRYTKISTLFFSILLHGTKILISFFSIL